MKFLIDSIRFITSLYYDILQEAANIVEVDIEDKVQNIKLLNNEIKKRKSDEKEAKKSAKLAEKQAKKPKHAKPRKPISLDSIPLIPRRGEPGETKQEENLRYRKNIYKLGAIALTGIITILIIDLLT